MKSLLEEIKDDIEAFVVPFGQALENIKDGIADKIDDAKYYQEEHSGKYAKKEHGCLSSVLSFLGWIIIISLVLSKCSNPDSRLSKVPSAQSVISVETTQSFVEESTVVDTNGTSNPWINRLYQCATMEGATLNRFPKQEDQVSDLFNRIDGEAYYVEPSQIFGENTYKRTNQSKRFLYFGRLDDNIATGYGLLCEISDADEGFLSYEGCNYNLLYAGQFKNGKYDGFGIKFRCSKYGLSFLHKLCLHEQDSEEYLTYYTLWYNYAEYVGEFEKGKMTGTGNGFFQLESEYGLSYSEMQLDHPTFEIYVGDYKNGDPHGKVKIYAVGGLVYDGEMRYGEYEGFGKLYHADGVTLKYEGNFKDSLYHGEGTLYSESGEVLYSGNWEYGDYGKWDKTEQKKSQLSKPVQQQEMTSPVTLPPTTEPIFETTAPQETLPQTNQETIENSNQFEQTCTVKMSSGGLNVRSGPGTNYGQVGRLNAGQTITVTEVQYNGVTQWGNIGSGWVCMDYVEIGRQQAPPQTTASISTNMTVCVDITVGELKIRSGPDTSYSEVGRLYGGEILTVTELQQSGSTQWGHIPQGWICMDYVDTVYGTQNERSEAQRFLGRWIENNNANKQYRMTIQAAEYGSFLAEIQISLSAFETMHWYTIAKYDANQNCLKYSDCKCWINVSDGNGNFHEEIQHENGQGKLFFSNGYLYWQDYTSDIENCPFLPE